MNERTLKESAIHIVWTILAILCIVAGAVGSLMLFVLLIAGSPNSTDAQIRLIKWLMLATVVGGLACSGLGVLLIVKSHPMWASMVGVFPMAFLIGLMIWCEVSR